jgi:peptidoglycan/xylan/chitin deacetylase (PgdA/CDA1 family)
MATAPRKKHLHKCKNHPRVTAKGRCIKCGSWICIDCAEIQHGQYICKDHTTTPLPANVPVSPSTTKFFPAAAASNRSMLWAAVTFSLCCIVAVLWAVREIGTLHNEIDSLQQNRLHLVSLLKESNQEITDLKTGLAENGPVPQRTSIGTTGRVRKLPDTDLETERTAEGIPLTFNNGAVVKPLVALTFDGGSWDNAAMEILDTLHSRNVKATMFLTGEFIRKYPDLTRRLVTEGHEVGNHMMDHKHLTSYSVDQTQNLLSSISPQIVADQLRTAEKLFHKITQSDFAPIWRAPYGEYNATLCKWALSCGYLHVGWRQGRTWRQNLDSNDWIPNEEEPGYKKPQEVLDKIINIAQTKPYGINGGIILMHLGTERLQKEARVHTILGILIDTLQSQGYSFVKISDMAGESGIDFSKLPSRKIESQTVAE